MPTVRRRPAGASACRQPGPRAAALVTAVLALVAGFLLAGAGGAAAVDGTSGPASTWISLIPATSSAIAPEPARAESSRSAEPSAAREPGPTHGAVGGDEGARGAGAADGGGGDEGAAAAEPESAPDVSAVGIGSGEPWLLAAMAAAVLMAGGGIVLRLRRVRQH